MLLMSLKPVSTVLACMFAICCAHSASAQSGETIYKQVCANCHTSGVANAPKFGDKAKWAPLIAEL